uniref:Uncharacterized protein n=1 Tax=Guillardia theta TaxID=55529 RepID=A0A7S4KVP0_GUITH|mmetsp:Transcript_32058/g.102115  ORF Transcript_32058/g.102115 Transcript_32058/m.102115 type:complete len:490 (+) Transcript_32058:178-1647(+)
MEWLQKAGDLLDKLDRTAAETLEAVSNDAAADADELKILMEGNDGGNLNADEPEAQENEAVSSTALSPRSSLQLKVEKLSKALAKKSSQIELLVTSHKSLLKSSAEREKEWNDKLDQAQREVEKAVTEQNKHRQAEQQAQLQTNAMRESLKAKADEIESMQRYMDQLRRENEEYSRRVIELEKSLEEQEESKDFLQRKYEEAQKQVEEARAEHKNQLLMFQDREQSLSSETVQFTRELAAAERRRQESEAAAKEAEERLRASEENSRSVVASMQTLKKEVEEHKHESQVLRSALKAKERHCEELREEFDNQTKGIRKKLEEAELQVRQLERTSHVKPHVREVNDNELEAQLNKMCEEVLAKQALLESLMSEKTALRSRLESEAIRNKDLQDEIARLHASNAMKAGGLGRDIENGLTSALFEPIACSLEDLLRSRDLSSIVSSFDRLIKHFATAVARDTSVRTIASIYLLMLQVSALIVLIHAVLGKHSH